MLLFAYLSLSFVVPVVFVLNYAYAYREYFTTVVQLTNSPTFRLLCVNAFIMVVVLLWFIARYLFFGKLNPAEKEVVRKTIPFYILECVGAPLYAGVSPFGFVSALALLTAVFAVLHRVARERTMTLQVVESQEERVRMLSGLALFFFLAMPFDLYIVFDALVNAARQQEEYLTLQYCAAVMYLQFAVSNLRLVLRLLFTEVIGDTFYRGLAFYVEVMFSLVRSFIFFISFGYVCFASHAPYFLIRILFGHILVFVKKIFLLVQYRALTKCLDEIPNASADVLSNDPRCAICYDNMLPEQSCKQLACGHCYHELCLRRWFETSSTCPYCRADLRRQMRGPTAAPSDADRHDHDTAAARLSPGRPEEEDVTDGAAREAWRPPNEAEMRREYARYCEAMRRGRQSQQPAAFATAGPGDERETRGAASRGVDGSNVEGHGSSFLLDPVAPTVFRGDAAAGAGDGERRRRGGAAGRGARMSNKDAQRLEAYRAYEVATRAAAEALQQRLWAIDMASEE